MHALQRWLRSDDHLIELSMPAVGIILSNGDTGCAQDAAGCLTRHPAALRRTVERARLAGAFEDRDTANIPSARSSTRPPAHGYLQMLPKRGFIREKAMGQYVGEGRLR